MLRMHKAVGHELAISAIVQYYKHPHTLMLIVERLLIDPRRRVEVLVHADSNTSADASVLGEAQARFPTSLLRVLHSENVHELRAYNKAATHARAPLLLFAQDDYLPPASPLWIEFVTTAFIQLGGGGGRGGGGGGGAEGGLDALGLAAGKLCRSPSSAQSSVGGAPFSSLPGRQSCLKIGMCGGYADNTTAADEPLAYVDVLVMGPIVVRASAYHAVGGFNISYSPAGKPGLGFEGAFSSHLWASGRRIAVSCASAALLFHNGCGGQGTLTHHGPKRGDRERREAGRRSNALWESEFPPPLGLSTVRAKIETARRELRSVALAGAMRRIRDVLPASAREGGCVPECADDDQIAQEAARARARCAELAVV